MRELTAKVYRVDIEFRPVNVYRIVARSPAEARRKAWKEYRRGPGNSECFHHVEAPSPKVARVEAAT